MRSEGTTFAAGRRVRQAAGWALLLAAGVSGSAIVAGERPDDGQTAGDPIALSPPGVRRQPPPNSSDNESLWRTAGALLVVVAGIGIALALVRRFIPGLSPGTTERIVQVISQCQLGGKGVVYVIRCGPRVLIVGATASQLTTLAEIADPHEIEQFLSGNEPEGPSGEGTQLAGSAMATSVTGLKDQVHGVLERIQSWKSST